MTDADKIGYRLAGRRWVAPALLLSAWCCAVLPGCRQEQVAHEPRVMVVKVPAPPVEPRRPREVPELKPPAPKERTVVLGRSVRGTKLVMHVFGEGEPAVFILGGIHGEEPTSAALAERFVEHLRANPSLWQDRTVAVLARANPDGLAVGTRVNSRGVDLNRNFPAANWRKSRLGRYYGGKKAACEPETRAIIKAVRGIKPGTIISIHSIAGGRQCNNWDGPAEALARKMAETNGYPPTGSIGYLTPGSMGSWAGIDRKIAMVTLELPAALNDKQCWQANRVALLEAVRWQPAPAKDAVGK